MCNIKRHELAKRASSAVQTFKRKVFKMDEIVKLITPACEDLDAILHGIATEQFPEDEAPANINDFYTKLWLAVISEAAKKLVEL